MESSPAGEAYRHSDKQLCPLQRPVSDFDRRDHYVLRRSCGSPASIYILHLDADRCNPPRYRDDPADIQVSLFHPSQGRTLFLRPRATALPYAPDRPGHCPLCL